MDMAHNPREAGLHLSRPVQRDVQDRPLEWRQDPRHLSVDEIRLARTKLGVERFSGPVRGLLVGECPGENTDEDMPLFPLRPTSAAGRLMDMSGLEPGEYLGCLYRRNVCYRRWTNAEARQTARYIMSSLFDHKNLFVVLCGQRVAEAFEVRTDFWRLGKLESRNCYTVIPHPSGLNRIYNDPSAREQTRLWVRFAALDEAAS